MWSSVIHALGGVGLFLAGMILLTESLRALAGQTLRRALAMFTQTPLSGAVTGAATTALIQSSSATTVTVVGFVTAGLMTFPQALGVIFGANLGTTITGWIVALIGFKLDLGEVFLPLIFAGALLRLLEAGRRALVGQALIGFGLLFIGLDVMQEAMAGLQGAVSPADFPGDTFFGRLELVVAGAAITAITQSSSAGLAAALVALGSGAINLPQAAALVIGLNVGTTITAILATLGGSAAARRTGWAHVMFNVATGAVALALLDPLSLLVVTLVGPGEDQIALVLFHTFFNLIGIALFLPFASRFAAVVTRLVPERGPVLTRRIEPSLLRDPDAATDAASATVRDTSLAIMDTLARRLGHDRPTRGDTAALRDISDATSVARDFISRIEPGAMGSARSQRIASALHILDHQTRLIFRIGQSERIETLSRESRLRRLRRVVRELSARAASGVDSEQVERKLNRLRRMLRDERERYRERTIGLASTRVIDDETALARLDALRWLHRVCYHLWRIQHHLNRIERDSRATSQMREAAIEVLED